MMTTIKAECVFGCGYSNTVEVSTADIERYRNGAMAQDAFPYLTADEREFFVISGICPECFEGIFS